MAQDKYGYIPPSVQRQMDQHMQQMPAHLQKYQGGNTYIPQKAAQEMTSYMKKTMPAHMQEYISPYVERQSQAGLNSLNPGTSRVVQERAPTPNLMRRDHSAYGEQHNVDVNAIGSHSNPNSLSYSPQYSGKSGTPAPAPPPVDLPSASQTPYDFIMQSQNSNKSKFGTGGSPKSRFIFLAIVGGVLFSLIIIVIAIVTSSGKSGTQSLISLAQEQNEIIRVSDIGVSKARTADAKNLAAITAYSFRSTQADTLALLAKQGHKLKTKDLALKQNSATDSELNTADLNNRFDETFKKLLATSLATYQQDVKHIYDTTSSKSEKTVLSTSYNGVSLLVDSQTTQSN
jgi:hypothetical protein